MAVADPAVSLDRLKQTARQLVALLGTAKNDRLVRPPRPDEWSVTTVVAHLADAEMVYGVRARMMLTDDRPYLAGYDEQAWVMRFAEVETDARESLARWRALRDANLRMFASLDPEEWRLTGMHAERGEVSVAKVAEIMADHDRDHLAQIRTALADD